MKKKLKDVLSLLDGNLTYQNAMDGKISAPANELCEVLTFVSGKQCTPENLPYFSLKLKEKNPGWFSNAVALVNANVDPDTLIFFGKCSLKDRADRLRSGAKVREHRKPFHVNIPDSIYQELTEPVIHNLKAFREAERTEKPFTPEGLKNININVPDGNIYKSLLFEIDKEMYSYCKETNGTGVIKSWKPLSDNLDIKDRAAGSKDLKNAIKAFNK